MGGKIENPSFNFICDLPPRAQGFQGLAVRRVFPQEWGQKKRKSVVLYHIKGSSVRNLETGCLQEAGLEGGLVTTPIKTLNKPQQLLSPDDNRGLKVAIRSLNSPDLFPGFTEGGSPCGLSLLSGKGVLI